MNVSESKRRVPPKNPVSVDCETRKEILVKRDKSILNDLTTLLPFQDGSF
jgi:hypothetical protein